MTGAAKQMQPKSVASTDDSAARKRAATALSESIALSAGAGSGKTSVLVDRIVTLLRSGHVRPRELAAVTFTEKAAGELLSRVRDALEHALHHSAEADKPALVVILDSFPELTLSTIHGFCRDLLLHESLEAGFAPATEVGAEAVDEELLTGTLATWRSELRTRRPTLWRIVDTLVTFAGLRDAASALNAYDGYADVGETTPFSEAQARAELAAALVEIERKESRCVAPDACKLVKNNRPLVATVENALKLADDSEAVLAVLTTDEVVKRTGGTKKDWGDDGKAAYIAALEGIDRWRDKWMNTVHGEVLRDLRAHVLPPYAALKRNQSIVTFDDLLKDAATLLRENHAARERLARRYRVILIDEVQDTDPVQAEIAALLSSAPDLTSVAPLVWDDAAPEPGRLFAVGDARQSIYRFRGADVSTWQRLENVIKKNGVSASLTRNFRSVPGIVAWVNHVFAELPGYQPQAADRAPAELDPIVCLELASAPSAEGTEEDEGDVEGEEAEGAADAEAAAHETDDSVDEVDAVIRHLHHLKNSGAKVFDRRNGEMRPLTNSDVMLLLPSWQSADATADRLRASGIECVVEGGDTFFSRDEVRLSVALLRALVEPGDTEAVAFVLRGLFGQSHMALATHRKNGGSLRFTLPSQPAGSATDALQILLRAHRERGNRSLSGLLDQVLSQTHALAVWKLMPDGLSRLANLDKLSSMVRQIESDTASPYAVVEELNRRARSIKEKEKDIDRIDDDGDAVRITSLFKAKGLEAPVIVLLHARRTPKSPTVVVDHITRRVAIKLSKLTPPGWADLVKQENAQDTAERRRWMYVAATRARDQLVICRSEKTPKGTPKGGAQAQLLPLEISPRGLPPDRHRLSHAELFPACDGVTVRVLRAPELPEVMPSQETFPGWDSVIDAQLTTPPTTGDPVGEARARAMRKSVRAAKLACLRWRAASAAGSSTASTSMPGALPFAPSSPTEGEAIPGAGGARAGRVVHAVMERLDLKKSTEALMAEVPGLVAVLARHAGLDEQSRKGCQTVVERILSNPLIEQARQAPERWHETPFTYHPRKGSVVAGTIDLCFPIDAQRKKWVVFDWKSKVPPKGSKLHDHYKEQLQKYAKALLQNLGDIEVIATEIVGPHQEFGVQATADEMLAEVPYAFREPLVELLERGAPEPKYDCDIGDAATISAALVWEEKKVAVVSDLDELDAGVLQSLTAEGWRVVDELNDAVPLLGLAVATAEDG